MVTTSRSWQSTANMRQELSDRPSTRMVHAPHSPSPQPYLVPVRPTTSRSMSRALMSTRTVARLLTPFRVNSMSCLSDMGEHPFGDVVDQFLAVPGGGADVVDRRHLVARHARDSLDACRIEVPAFQRVLGARRA